MRLFLFVAIYWYTNMVSKAIIIIYSWFHIKGTWNVHLFNGDYLSTPEGTGSCGYLFHEIPGSFGLYYYSDPITLLGTPTSYLHDRISPRRGQNRPRPRTRGGYKTSLLATSTSFFICWLPLQVKLSARHLCLILRLLVWCIKLPWLQNSVADHQLVFSSQCNKTKTKQKEQKKVCFSKSIHAGFIFNLENIFSFTEFVLCNWNKHKEQTNATNKAK